MPGEVQTVHVFLKSAKAAILQQLFSGSAGRRVRGDKCVEERAGIQRRCLRRPDRRRPAGRLACRGAPRISLPSNCYLRRKNVAVSSSSLQEFTSWSQNRPFSLSRPGFTFPSCYISRIPVPSARPHALPPPRWPHVAHPANTTVVFAQGRDGVSSAVMLTPYAISYLALEAAVNRNRSMASLRPGWCGPVPPQWHGTAAAVVISGSQTSFCQPLNVNFNLLAFLALLFTPSPGFPEKSLVSNRCADLRPEQRRGCCCPVVRERRVRDDGDRCFVRQQRRQPRAY